MRVAVVRLGDVGTVTVACLASQGGEALPGYHGPGW